MRDLSQQATPLDDDAVDIAGAEKVGDPDLFGERVLMDRGDDLLGARAVFGRHAVLEVAWDRLKAIFLMANNAQSPAPAVDVLAGEAEPGIKIREVVDQLVEGIGVVLQCGGNGQAVTLAEEADDLSAKAGDASRIHQAKPPPKQGDPRAGRQLAADGDQIGRASCR